MDHPGPAALVRGALGAILLTGMIGSSPAAAQAPPPCAPEKIGAVTLKTQERSLDTEPVATHPVTVTAEVGGIAEDVTVAPPAGVDAIAGGRGDGGVVFVVPAVASMTLAVTWVQLDEEGNGCAASRTLTLAVLAARAARAVRRPGPPGGASVAVLPARTRPDLSPLEISVATVATARFPPAPVEPRTMVVPLRAEDQVEYAKALPRLHFIKLPALCRFFFLTCGPVTSSVAALQIDRDALRRGIVRGDPDGPVSLLARTQPALHEARYGLVVDTGPAKNKVYGLDLQIRQSGRLLARVRRAGRCRTAHGPRGDTYRCTVSRARTQLR